MSPTPGGLGEETPGSSAGPDRRRVERPGRGSSPAMQDRARTASAAQPWRAICQRYDRHQAGQSVRPRSRFGQPTGARPWSGRFVGSPGASGDGRTCACRYRVGRAGGGARPMRGVLGGAPDRGPSGLEAEAAIERVNIENAASHSVRLATPGMRASSQHGCDTWRARQSRGKFCQSAPGLPA